MNNIINVLDHGSVRLVEHMGSDLSIVRNARVSYDAEWRSGEDEGKDAKLIDYLVKHSHTSPLEAVNFTFDVRAPLFVARQWMRHRTWCLAGDTKLEFVRPCDGKPYKLTIGHLAKSWNPPAAKHRRADPSRLSLEEHNRSRISGMKLRCRGSGGEIEETSITDVWMSGTKQLYRIVAGKRVIRASGDHLFHSDGVWVKAENLAGRNVTLLGYKGNPRRPEVPVLTEDELANEQWAEFHDGYRVSTLGRVQTLWGQGRRSKGSIWMDKTITCSNRRAVVNIKNKVMHVSAIVASMFLPPKGDMEVLRHLDDNPMDNRLQNLAWGSPKDNSNDAKINGGRATRSWVSVPVTSITKDGIEPVYDVTVAHKEHNFVANNFLVHNCFNEISARYSELPAVFYTPWVDQITTQSPTNKQMRTKEQHPQALYFQDLMRKTCEDAFTAYKEMIDAGVPRELARGVLPMNTYTHFFCTVDLHNLMKFCKLRLHAHAQHEIQVYAQAMLDLAKQVAPITIAAVERHWIA